MNHPSKEGGLFTSTLYKIFLIFATIYAKFIWISHIKMLYLYQMRFDWETVLPLKPIRR